MDPLWDEMLWDSKRTSIDEFSSSFQGQSHFFHAAAGNSIAPEMFIWKDFERMLFNNSEKGGLWLRCSTAVPDSASSVCEGLNLLDT